MGSEYEGREQSLVKHIILRKYLERFAHIIGSRRSAITYIDCFSGPWHTQTDDHGDSSFAIALKELRTARATLRGSKPLRLRCYFLEKDKRACGELEQFAARVADAEIRTRNATLVEAVPDILQFVEQGRQRRILLLPHRPHGLDRF